jgi:mono/diheme cytochrome c family protein
MSSKDNGLESRTNGWMVAGLVLMLAGLLAFPIYRIYEPTARAEANEEAKANLAAAGSPLWVSTCSSCHGYFGQGVDAPALNSQQFLTIATNEQIFSIVSSGVPGTDMAAYSQQFGGPLTSQQIASLVACVQSWEPTAPDRPDWRDMLDAPGAGHDEGGHDEGPADHDEDGADDHDEAVAEGPPACGPEYDPALLDALDDHDADGIADHDEVPADDHDEVPADDHDDEVPADDHDDEEPADDGDDEVPADDGDDEVPADDHDDEEPADGDDEEPADDHADDGHEH